MKRTLASMVAVAILLASPVLAAAGDALVGVWLTEPDEVDGRAHVEVTADGDRYNGKIIWMEKPNYTEDYDDGEVGRPKVDNNNPDPALRSRPIIGLQILEGFLSTGDKSWGKGTIYDPGNGKKYKCKIKLLDDGTLKVRGFVGVSLIGRTSIWTPVESSE
jgi:uncharacterized protein (DUF2147 family)